MVESVVLLQALGDSETQLNWLKNKRELLAYFVTTKSKA